MRIVAAGNNPSLTSTLTERFPLSQSKMTIPRLCYVLWRMSGSPVSPGFGIPQESEGPSAHPCKLRPTPGWSGQGAVEPFGRCSAGRGAPGNRPNWLSAIGVARCVSSVAGTRRRLPDRDHETLVSVGSAASWAGLHGFFTFLYRFCSREEAEMLHCIDRVNLSRHQAVC